MAAGTVTAGIVGAVIAVPLVAVLYSSIRFWANTGSRSGFTPPRQILPAPAPPCHEAAACAAADPAVIPLALFADTAR